MAGTVHWPSQYKPKKRTVNSLPTTCTKKLKSFKKNP